MNTATGESSPASVFTTLQGRSTMFTGRDPRLKPTMKRPPRPPDVLTEHVMLDLECID